MFEQSILSSIPAVETVDEYNIVKRRVIFICIHPLLAFLLYKKFEEFPIYKKDVALYKHDTLIKSNYLFDKNSSIPLAPALPASIARITVAAPVTASPPA